MQKDFNDSVTIKSGSVTDFHLARKSILKNPNTGRPILNAQGQLINHRHTQTRPVRSTRNKNPNYHGIGCQCQVCLQYAIGRIHLTPRQEADIIIDLTKDEDNPVEIIQTLAPKDPAVPSDVTRVLANATDGRGHLLVDEHDVIMEMNQKEMLRCQIKNHMPTQRKRRLVQSLIAILLTEREHTTIRGKFETFFYHGNARLAWNHQGGFNYAKIHKDMVQGDEHLFEREKFVVVDSFRLP